MIGTSTINYKPRAVIIYDIKKAFTILVLLQNFAVVLVDVDLSFLFKKKPLEFEPQTILDRELQ